MTCPTHAMILAAGLGLRMRPITERRPKPLISVAGRTMLDRVLDHLDDVGTEQRVINTHWLAPMIEAHLAGRPGIVFSPEAELLETGGGVRQALPLLGPAPFYVCNADIIWQNGTRPALLRLAEAWVESRMDALLLLAPTTTAFGYDGRGDFFLASDGALRRRSEHEVSPFLFSGVQILHPRLFDGCPSGKFSLNLLYDKAASESRLFGIRHDGAWLHIGTPSALAEAEARLADKI